MKAAARDLLSEYAIVGGELGFSYLRPLLIIIIFSFQVRLLSVRKSRDKSKRGELLGGVVLWVYYILVFNVILTSAA